MFDQIAQILEDLFDIPVSMIDKEDELQVDWAIRGAELELFNREFCAEFEVDHIPDDVRTIEQYMELVNVD